MYTTYSVYFLNFKQYLTILIILITITMTENKIKYNYFWFSSLLLPFWMKFDLIKCMWCIN